MEAQWDEHVLTERVVHLEHGVSALFQVMVRQQHNMGVLFMRNGVKRSTSFDARPKVKCSINEFSLKEPRHCIHVSPGIRAAESHNIFCTAHSQNRTRQWMQSITPTLKLPHFKPDTFHDTFT